MRILHLFDFYLPSTLSWVAQLLARLDAQRSMEDKPAAFQIEVAAPWIVSRGPFAPPQIQFHLFPPQAWMFPSLQSEWEHPLARYLFTRSQRFLPAYRAWLFQRLRHDPPDVLHAHYGPTGCLYLPLAQRLDRPLVTTFYGFDYEKLLRKRPVFRKKYRELFAGADRIIAASAAGCEALEALGCPGEKLAMVRPAPGLEHFPFVRRTKTAGQLRLLQAATFTEKKGHLITLKAFRRALADCPGLHLTLSGEKWDKSLVNKVRAFILQHNLSPHITWLDFVPHGQMAGFLAGFHAFIQPSQHATDGDHEASPVALLEAQATGLPILATNHFDLPDQVQDGITGLLTPERDAAALAESIRRFYRMDEQAYRGFSERAHRWVEQRFGVGESARALGEIYRGMAGRRNK